MSNIIGNRINYLRFLQGDITLSELADSIGVSRQTISKLESGASKPNLDTLELVADYFDVSMDYILGKTDNLNPGKEQVGSLHLSDTALYLLRQDKELGKIMSLLIEDLDFRSVVKDVNKDFSSTEDAGYDLTSDMYESAIEGIKKVSKEEISDDDPIIKELRSKSRTVDFNDMEKYVPAIKNALANIKSIYYKDSSEREKILVIQGQFKEIISNISDSVAEGKKVNKIEMVGEFLNILSQANMLGIDTEDVKSLSEIVVKLAKKHE